MAKSQRAKPELKVVFETSALWTKVVYELFSSEVSKLIKSNSQHSDLSIKWYVPSVVVEERRYQMEREAFTLFPYVNKLERLLGHNLNITEDILKNRVDEAIKKQLGELSISTLDIDTSQVDWKSLIGRAVHRLPPFEHGGKEKGFRDSIIAETFLQLVSQSPTTPSVCRLAIVTNDNLLSDYLKSCTKKTKNTRILSTAGELESLINTLVSKVTEKFITDIKERIKTYFFEVGNETGLYFKEKIRDKIRESYSEQLRSVPEKEFERENGTWFISEPVFLKKVRQRTFWTTSISIEATLFKYEWSTPQRYLFYDSIPGEDELSSISNVRFVDLTSGKGITKLPSTPIADALYDIHGKGEDVLPSTPIADALYDIHGKGGDVLPSTPKWTKITVAIGKSKFEIHWSVNVTPKKKFTHPRIEEIKFIDTKWERKD